MNYRDEAPKFYKDLNSNNILAYFEDERVTQEEIDWFKSVLADENYRLHKNPISKWNWAKIKNAFAKKFFPEIAPENKAKKPSIEDRISNLLNM